jgi:hypothetical protein
MRCELANPTSGAICCTTRTSMSSSIRTRLMSHLRALASTGPTSTSTIRPKRDTPGQRQPTISSVSNHQAQQRMYSADSLVHSAVARVPGALLSAAEIGVIKACDDDSGTTSPP